MSMSGMEDDDSTDKADEVPTNKKKTKHQPPFVHRTNNKTGSYKDTTTQAKAAREQMKQEARDKKKQDKLNSVRGKEKNSE